MCIGNIGLCSDRFIREDVLKWEERGLGIKKRV